LVYIKIEQKDDWLEVKLYIEAITGAIDKWPQKMLTYKVMA
jgi:hypothetical protein